MSAPSCFIAGLLAGAAAMLAGVLLRLALRAGPQRRRRLLLAGGLGAAAAAAVIGGMVFAIGRGAAGAAAPAIADSAPPAMPPASAMPSDAVMSRVLRMSGGSGTPSAEPMDQAAADLASRLERQGGTAADWNLLAQAYDFLGRSEDARRARARAAEAGAIQRSP